MLKSLMKNRIQLAFGICRFSVHRFHQRQIDIFKTFTLFLVALDFHCCMQAFSSCRELGLLFIAVCGLLIAVPSLVVEHRL